MSISSLKNFLRVGDFKSFDSAFVALSSCTDAEARELMDAVGTSGILNAKPLLSAILKMNDRPPPPGVYAPDVDWVYRGCKDLPHEVKNQGFLPHGTSSSITFHKFNTGCSCYVSCTKDLKIATEFAASQAFAQRGIGYIYKIRATKAIDCAKWFHPVPEYHSVEAEVLFLNSIPPEDIVAFSSQGNPAVFVPL